MPKVACENIRICGISAAVPKNKVANKDLDFLDEQDKLQLIERIGIKFRRIASPEQSAASLCTTAAKRLMIDLSWEPNQIDFLVFVSQTPRHNIPGDASLIQVELNLKKDCMVLDINQGCAGYVYGMMVICSLLSNTKNGKGLLLVGDTISKTLKKGDKSTEPIFSDAGSATAIEQNNQAGSVFFNLQSDGLRFKAIHQARNGFLEMNGLDVYYFSSTEVPKNMEDLLEFSSKKKEAIDFYIFHQANLILNESIRKKLQVPQEKVPYSLENYGNTSCASIPLTLIDQLASKLKGGSYELAMSGFGVGLSWASMQVNISDIVCSELIEV